VHAENVENLCSCLGITWDENNIFTKNILLNRGEKRMNRPNYLFNMLAPVTSGVYNKLTAQYNKKYKQKYR
jgi:hypothetical protein